MEFPYKKGDIVQSELFVKMYYEVNNCRQTSEDMVWNGVKRVVHLPYMDCGLLTFDKNNIGNYEEDIIFEQPARLDFYHNVKDEYPHDNPERLAVKVEYALTPPKEQGKSYDPAGCGLSFSTKLRFDNKAFNEQRSKQWFVVESIGRSYDDDCETYNDYWTMILKGIDKIDEKDRYVLCDGTCFSEYSDVEIENESIILSFEGKNIKGIGFDKNKIKLVKKNDENLHNK